MERKVTVRSSAVCFPKELYP